MRLQLHRTVFRQGPNSCSSLLEVASPGRSCWLISKCKVFKIQDALPEAWFFRTDRSFVVKDWSHHVFSSRYFQFSRCKIPVWHVCQAASLWTLRTDVLSCCSLQKERHSAPSHRSFQLLKEPGKFLSWLHFSKLPMKLYL